MIEYNKRGITEIFNQENVIIIEYNRLGKREGYDHVEVEDMTQ